MKALRSLALAVLLTVPAVAFATDPGVEVGIALYANRDYHGAASALTQALNRGLPDPNDRAAASLTLAASYEGLNDPQRARVVLTQLFREQPNVRIDPRIFSPEFIRHAEQVRSEVVGHGAPTSPPPSQPPATPPPQQPPPPQTSLPTPPQPTAPTPAMMAAPPWRGPHGFQLGLRAGYAIPFGDEVGGVRLSDDISYAFPFELDLGWRIDPRWYIGGWFAGGPVHINSACFGGCHGSVASTGLEGEFHMNPLSVDPWLGFGVGYEYLFGTFVTGGFITDTTLSGITFFRAGGGLDVRVSPLFTFGPYVHYALGEYSSFSQDGFGVYVPNHGVHSFLTFGIRSTFNFE